MQRTLWTSFHNVQIDMHTKKGILNGLDDPNDHASPPEAAKDQTARGICLAGNTVPITAVTFTDSTTTYRGLYMKNAQQVVGINFHSEDAPAHGVYVDGGNHFTFIGGFFENAGYEKASGDATVYRSLRRSTGRAI
jgi:hypothetical protein